MKIAGFIAWIALIIYLTPAALAADVAASGVAATATLQTTQISAAPQPSDEYDWKGDKVKLLSDVINIKATIDTAGQQNYFAPDGSIFDVVTDDKKTNKLTVKFRKDNIDGNRNAPSSQTRIEEHGTYSLDKAAVENALHKRYGWAFGALLVPFKYQLSDKSFSGSTTIGPYFGYKIQNSSGSITPVISAGWVGNIAVPLANGSGTVNRSGFTIAAGLIFSIDKGTGTQIGVLFGQDRLGSNAVAPYQYEGDTWFSMSIGFKFI